MSYSETGFVEKTQGPYDNKVMGVYSENPGFRLSQKDATINGGKAVPIALVGRVPVKVSTENGPIHTGDVLTTSSTPGVAMRATEPGMSLGRAMEDFSCKEQFGPFGPGDSSASPSSSLQNDPGQACSGKVMTYVNVSYADPSVNLTSLGDLNVAEVKNHDSAHDALGQLISDPSKFVVTDKDGSKVTKVGAFDSAAIGTLKAGEVDAKKISINGVDLLDLLSTQGSSSTQAAELGREISELTLRQDSTQEKLASLEERLNNLEDFTNLTASAAAMMGDLRIAELTTSSESAQVARTLGNLDVEAATVSGNLTVLGRTLLSDVGVTGNFNVGLLTFSGDRGSLDNVGGTLKLQSFGTGGVDILAGKVTINKDGDITTKGGIVAETVKAKSVETGKLNISTQTSAEQSPASAVLSASAGTIIIRAGQTSVDINTTALTTKSLIFTTPEDPVAVGSKKKDADTFTIKLAAPQTKDMKINWWIVN